MENKSSFICFMIFNIFFLFSGFGIIGGAVYLIIKISINTLSFVMIAIGLIIILIFSLGFKSKNSNLLVLYLLFTFIIFLFYAGLSVMLKLFPDLLIKHIKSKITDHDEIDNIKTYNMLLFIISCVGASFCFLAFLSGICYYCKSKTKNKKDDIPIDDMKQNDLLFQIDYSHDNSNTTN